MDTYILPFSGIRQYVRKYSRIRYSFQNLQPGIHNSFLGQIKARIQQFNIFTTYIKYFHNLKWPLDQTRFDNLLKLIKKGIYFYSQITLQVNKMFVKTSVEPPFPICSILPGLGPVGQHALHIMDRHYLSFFDHKQLFHQIHQLVPKIQCDLSCLAGRS